MLLVTISLFYVVIWCLSREWLPGVLVDLYLFHEDNKKSPWVTHRYKNCMVICNMNDSLNLLLIRKRKREILAITLQTLTCQVLMCMEIASLLKHARSVKGFEVNLVLLLRVLM